MVLQCMIVQAPYFEKGDGTQNFHKHTKLAMMTIEFFLNDFH